MKLFSVLLRWFPLNVCVCIMLTTAWVPSRAATPTTTTLMVNPASTIAFQHPVQLVATVKDGSGNPVLLGTVTFYADKAILGTVHLVGNGNNGLTVGSATLWTRLLTVGAHSLTAAYNGITADAPSVSAAQTFTVTNAAGPYPSMTVLTSTGDTNGQYGLTVNVGGFGPASLSGSVTINDATAASVLGTPVVSGTPVLFGLNPTSLDAICPRSVAAGDFNNDGIPDLVVGGVGYGDGSCNGGSVLQTLLGNGDGTFVSGPTMAVVAWQLLAADFNVDGNLDIYVGNAIYLGNGDGSFQPNGLPIGPSPPGAAAVGDVNGDGLPDLVIPSNSNVVICVNKGDGNFSFAEISFSDDPSQFENGIEPPMSVAVGDLNQDGMDDVVVNSGTSLWVFLSTGDVAVPTVSSYSNGDTVVLSKIQEGVVVAVAGETATSVTLRDLNGDGKLDAVIGSYGFGANGNTPYPNQVSVLLGDGNGAFTPANVFPISSNPVSDIQVLLGGFTYDAKLDVVAYSMGAPQMGAFLLSGDGTGALGSGMPIAGVTNTIPSPIAPDLLSDGSNDLVMGIDLASTLTILHSASGSAVSLSNVTVPGQGPQVITASYPGDSNYAASNSNQVTLDTRTPVTVQAGASSLSAFAGYPVTITASVSAPQGGLAPTGTIQFYNGSTALGSPVSLSGGNASYSVSFANPGLQYLRAVYSGDSNYQPASSPAWEVNIVNQAKPALSLTLTQNVQPYGTPLSVTVTLATIPGPPPTGTVSLTMDGGLVGKDVLSGNSPFSLPFTLNPTVGQHLLAASYSGDTNWSSTSATPDAVVITGSTALSISYGGSTSVSSGTPFVITGQLTTAESGPSPTGIVSVLDNGTAIANSTLAGSPPFALSFTVNMATQPLSTGTHVLSLNYSGDGNWQKSTSSNVTMRAGASAAVGLSSNVTGYGTAVSNANVQFTATVTPVGSTTPPTGTVQFYDGTSPIGALVPLLNGAAAFTSTAFAVGPHSVTAAYSGDTTYPSSTSTPITFRTVAKGATTVSLYIHPPGFPTILGGNPVRIDVTVSDKTLGPLPTGTVTLLDSRGKTITSGTLQNTGEAQTIIYLDSPYAGFTLGANTVTFQYSGDSSWEASQSPITFQLVLGQPVFSGFTCNLSTPIPDGTSFHCTATFTTPGTAPPPANPVNLLDNGRVIASQTLTGSSPYAIAFTLNSAASPLASGTHALSMSFAQDAHWLSATTAPVTVTVNADIPALALSSNLGSFGSVVQGTTITFTATETGGAGIPSGTVQFYVDGNAAGSPVTMSGGVASYSTSTLTPGTNQVTAAYSGDAHYHSATTNGVASVVTHGPDSLSLAVQGPATVNTGTPITITGSLAVGALGPPPTGTVSLLDGSTVVATTSLSGKAPVSVSFNVNTPTQPLAPGTHSFSLNYGGETHWAAGVSTASIVTVIQSAAATTTAVSSTQSAVAEGTSVTLTATVSSSQSAPAMTGTVQFYDGSAVLGQAQGLVNGSASYTASSLAAGPHSITAVYSGEANYKPSTSAVFTVEIQDFALKTSTPTLSVNPGAAVTLQLQVTAEGGFDATTKFTCSGVPAATTCSLSPSQVSGSGSVTATIVTSGGKAAANRTPINNWLRSGEVFLACVVLLIVPPSRRRKVFTWLVIVFAVLLVSAQGCGGNSSSGAGGGNTGTPAGTYTITISGTTSASTTILTHSVQVMLTVN